MRKQIIEILTEICPGIDFENDVELGVDDLTPENFNSVEAIEDLIESRQN